MMRLLVSRSLPSILVAFLWPLFAPGHLNGALITFQNGDDLDGDGVGDTATFLIDGVEATLTTRSVLPDGVVNTTSGALGVNADGSDTPGSFDPGESWAFDWSIDTFFAGVDFASFSTETEQFSLHATDWIGLSLTPGSAAISFDQGTGTFSFTSGEMSDDFDLDDISGGVPLALAAGSDLTITFTGSLGDSATLQSMTFATPEPATVTFLGLILLVAVLAYIRNRRVSASSRR